jgi:hypothetical protein
MSRSNVLSIDAAGNFIDNVNVFDGPGIGRAGSCRRPEPACTWSARSSWNGQTAIRQMG